MEGDIVLAVNQVPVSRPEDADRALKKSWQLSYTTIYAIDMSNFRDSIVEEISKDFPGSSVVPELSHTYLFVNGGAVRARLECDLETQYLSDPDRFTNLMTTATAATRSSNGTVPSGDYFNRELSFSNVQGKVILPFLASFNDSMEAQMRSLEETVCCEAWKYSQEKAAAAATKEGLGTDRRREYMRENGGREKLSLARLFRKEQSPGRNVAKESFPGILGSKESFPGRSAAKESSPGRSVAKESSLGRNVAKESSPGRLGSSKESSPSGSSQRTRAPHGSSASSDVSEQSDSEEGESISA
jgi:hypothetical protein